MVVFLSSTQNGEEKREGIERYRHINGVFYISNEKKDNIEICSSSSIFIINHVVEFVLSSNGFRR